MATDEAVRVNANVPNTGLITNLPDGCCVEVPCLVDRNGVQPTHYGSLPPQCASVNMTNINVQRMAVHAALTGGLEDTFRGLRWDGWEQEVSVLGPDTGLSLYPPPFTREGQDIGSASRRPVPLAELHAFYKDAADQLGPLDM